ncbi:hypothetical protein [Rahnella contaminans]|uniref:hypothetical protein n=1 Tax=Rahnella contaminans TaxID=2703882 RepID=UPI003C2C6C7E
MMFDERADNSMLKIRRKWLYQIYDDWFVLVIDEPISLRHGLESTVDKRFISFGDEVVDDSIEVLGVVTHVILDMRNDVFDDTVVF